MAYRERTCQHAVGNAHHLRELVTIAETAPGLPPPQLLSDLLCDANDATQSARADGLAALLKDTIEDFVTRSGIRRLTIRKGG